MTDDIVDDEGGADFDTLLRGRGEDLDPPVGAWPTIERRARRRKQLKGLVAAAAGIVVVAGATPAVLAVRGSSDSSRLQVADSPHHNPTTMLGDNQVNPVVRARLDKLVPTSVTFVSQYEGWATGVLKVRGGTVAGGLAHTITGGATWSIQAPNPVPQGSVRFADSKQGISFGETYQVTNDGGLTWQTLPSPGYIADLETSNGVIWALVRSCEHCDGLRLFQATLTSPTLVRVSSVRPIERFDASITLHSHAIYVTGGKDMWASTNDGYSWSHPHNPCGGGSQSFAAWSEEGLAAECTPDRGVGSLFESIDAGRNWTDIANVPHVQAAVGTLSAGSPDELLITAPSGAPYVSHHHGNHWARATLDGSVILAAYISNSHIVGLTGGPLPAFVTSFDNGRTWVETPFRADPSP
ncbi:MAG TPA: hypothetical protein VHC43_08570 [Mycobacteriales bacterium]|nr:hypothetical protein [Mycobacteriales bacterium]